MALQKSAFPLDGSSTAPSSPPGHATPTPVSTETSTSKAHAPLNMFAAVERGTARTPWEFSIPRSSLENEGCTGARKTNHLPR